jgi:hypothetical protein
MHPLALGTLATRAWHAYVCNWRCCDTASSKKRAAARGALVTSARANALLCYRMNGYSTPADYGFRDVLVKGFT